MNMPAGAVNYQTAANNFASTNTDDPYTYFPTNVAIGSLHAGTNVVAVEIHKYAASLPALAFDLELFGQGVPLPTLAYSASPGALQLTWPTNLPRVSTCKPSTNLPSGGAWQIVPGPYPQSNGSFGLSIPINTNSAQYFRLIK